MALSALASSPSGGSPRRTSSPSFGPLRVMLSVEAHSRPLCQMVCGQLLSAKGRGDKLLMAQVVPSQQTSQQQANHRRLLESFQAIALGHRTPADKSFVLTCGAAGGGADDQLLQAVEEHAVGMLAIQVPSGSKTLPKPLLKIMRSCKGAVLIFQEAVAGDGALIKQMAAVESDKP